MPTYFYKCDACGTEVTKEKSMSECQEPELCPNDGMVMYRNFMAEHGGTAHNPGNWPMESYAAGISPDEIPEFRKIDAEGGVPTDYTPDGDVIFTSAKHRREYCKLHGLFDRNAGFHDPVPENR